MLKRFLAASISFVVFSFFVFGTNAFGFTTSNTSITCTFDNTVVEQNGVVTGTVILSNNESYAMHGFFLTLQVPNGVVVNTQQVNIIENGTVNNISGYLVEIGDLDDIYAGHVPYRWAIESPAAFNENHPIPAGASVEIIFTVTSTSGGTFDLEEFSWAGYFSDAPEGDQAAFGYSEASDAQSITFATSIPLPASGTFGRSVPGAETDIDTVDLSFDGTSGNMTIAYQAYDVDTETEIEILINGQRIGYAPLTTNNSWSGIQTITLPDAYVNDDSINIISFNNTYNPPNKYVWGIRDVATGTAVDDGISLPAFGAYGRNAPGITTNVDKVDFSFAETLGDVTITYEAYDVDYSTEIEILINGNRIGYAAQTANNSWGNMAVLIVPDEYVNDTANNVLTFNNTYNPPNAYVWGVRNVTHGIPLPASGAYGLGASGAKRVANEVDMSFNGTLGDVTLTYEAYDVDFETEIEILINDEHVGYVPVTGNNTWGGMQVVVIPDEYVNDDSVNIVTFNNTYNPPNAYVWGVRNVAHGIPLSTSDVYGNGVASVVKIVNEIDFYFDGTAGDVTISYEAYDVDYNVEVEILINDEPVGYVPITENNSWSGVNTVILPDGLVNNDSVNIITFNNTYNPSNSFIWGVRNVMNVSN